ncbi:MAG: hypothetical protein GY943_38390 [Chloroflexi bacterium]|nr:hypothetical protein [Chloroflexota bacterium]
MSTAEMPEGSSDDFVPYSADKLAQLTQFPEATAVYYQQCAEIGKRPLLFHLIPHVLYLGTIDTTTHQKVAISVMVKHCLELYRTRI